MKLQIKQMKKEMNTLVQIANRASKFSNIGGAVNYRHNMINAHKYSIVMGNDMKYWIVTNREASILEKAGYERITFREELELLNN